MSGGSSAAGMGTMGSAATLGTSATGTLPHPRARNKSRISVRVNVLAMLIVSLLIDASGH
jgi:hypothetical protein